MDEPWEGWRRLRDAPINNTEEFLDSDLLDNRPSLKGIAALGVYTLTHITQALVPAAGIYFATKNPCVGVGAGVVLAGY